MLVASIQKAMSTPCSRETEGQSNAGWVSKHFFWGGGPKRGCVMATLTALTSVKNTKASRWQYNTSDPILDLYKTEAETICN